MAKRHMLYGWIDIVMARNRSVHYPSSVVPSGLFPAPCPSRSSMRSHPLPSRGGVGGGVCNVCNILCCHFFAATSLLPLLCCHFFAATSLLPLHCCHFFAAHSSPPLFAETSSPPLFADRKLLTLQTPPLPLHVRAGFKRGVPHVVPAAVKVITFFPICFSCFYLFLFVFSQAA